MGARLSIGGRFMVPADKVDDLLGLEDDGDVVGMREFIDNYCQCDYELWVER